MATFCGISHFKAFTFSTKSAERGDYYFPFRFFFLEKKNEAKINTFLCELLETIKYSQKQVYLTSYRGQRPAFDLHIHNVCVLQQSSWLNISGPQMSSLKKLLLKCTQIAWKITVAGWNCWVTRGLQFYQKWIPSHALFTDCAIMYVFICL